MLSMVCAACGETSAAGVEAADAGGADISGPATASAAAAVRRTDLLGWGRFTCIPSVVMKAVRYSS
jgi:hypothetical protein